MDANRISEAASVIKKAEHALEWLKSYGHQISGSTFDTNGCATAVTGHGEAKTYLTSVLRESLSDIVEGAKMRCEIDIATAREVIRQEAAL